MLRLAATASIWCRSLLASPLRLGIFGDLPNVGAVALGLILKFRDDGGQSLDKDEERL